MRAITTVIIIIEIMIEMFAIIVNDLWIISKKLFTLVNIISCAIIFIIFIKIIINITTTLIEMQTLIVIIKYIVTFMIILKNLNYRTTINLIKLDPLIV